MAKGVKHDTTGSIGWKLYVSSPAGESAKEMAYEYAGTCGPFRDQDDIDEFAVQVAEEGDCGWLQSLPKKKTVPSLYEMVRAATNRNC